VTGVRRLVSLVAAVVAATVLLGVAPALAFQDLTVTPKAKHSRAYREQVDLTTWRASPHGQQISWRESNNVCHVVNPSGSNRGKWQMTLSLWRSFGGRQFARAPERATCKEQDRVARRVWIDSWWWPWGG
jgi:hypothetical protein